ncbi:hypothetical protein HN51_021594 [Arachis hypogaea]|uniref:protein DOWNY MILDEW RESISTANCE 6-like n=1 Tax=Arachis hypogaea TaxID=3818 RepID=UPI000DECC25E|nr:protein DOWNY MILDEW RESISTANCE 6-like [Arachis hypogaea]
MEKLVSSWGNNVKALPHNYIFPPELRPGNNLKIPFTTNIPTDLSELENYHHRFQTIQKIIKASEEFGFFQVINHGVDINLMKETRKVMKELFEMGDEYKQKLYSEDPLKPCRLYTSRPTYATDGNLHLWRDSFIHPCHPLDQWQHLWPQNPTKYREYVGACSVEVKKLASRILRLISEGVGLECEYFEKGGLSGSMLVSLNHYPACPEPSLTLGVSKHSDPNLVTILLQDYVSGLQVLHNGKWIAVEPLPDAFLVNVGFQLQIISNGRLQCCDHRVVTNSSDARTTAAFFVAPLDDSFIEPAQAFIDEYHPPFFKSFKYKDFRSYYIAEKGDTEVVMESFLA